MSASESLPLASAAITEDVVKTLGQIAGLNFPAERLPAITQRLRDMHALAADLDVLDLHDSEPAIRFDPSWPEGGTQ